MPKRYEHSDADWEIIAGLSMGIDGPDVRELMIM